MVNSRWSWGGATESKVILKGWQTGNIKGSEGENLINVLADSWKADSVGLPERKRHLEAIKEGTPGYVVLSRNATAGTFGDMDTNTRLYKIDGFKVIEGETYAIVTSSVAFKVVKKI